MSSTPRIAHRPTGRDNTAPLRECDIDHTRLMLWSHIFGDELSDEPRFISLFSGRRDPDTGKIVKETTHTMHYAWPDKATNAAQWVEKETNDGRDVYHCAHLVTARKRKKENAAPVRCLWTELDTGDIPEHVPSPTAIIRSSERGQHVYWQLTRAIAPEQAEALNKRLALAIGSNADPSGVDLTQLLRPAGTRNFKYDNKPAVTLTMIDDALSYDPDDLDRVLPALPAATLLPQTNERGDEPPVRLPAARLDFYHGRRKAKDRSGQLYGIAKDLYDAGASLTTIAGALRNRDLALFPDDPKYANRDNADDLYLTTARNAAIEVEKEQAFAATIPTQNTPTPASAPDGMACVAELARIAELEQQLAAMTARAERSEQITATILQVLDNPSYTPQQAVAYIRMQADYNLLADHGRVDANGEVVLYLPRLSRERPVLDPETGETIPILNPETGEPITFVDRNTGEVKTKVKTVAAMSPSTISRALKEVAAISGAFVIGETTDPVSHRPRITMTPAHPETRRTMAAVASAQVYRDRRRGPGRGKPKDARIEHIEPCPDCGDHENIVIKAHAVCAGCLAPLGTLKDEIITAPFLSETEEGSPPTISPVEVVEASLLKRSQARDRFHEARAQHYEATDSIPIQVETLPPSSDCTRCRRPLLIADRHAGRTLHTYDCMPLMPAFGGD